MQSNLSILTKLQLPCNLHNPDFMPLFLQNTAASFLIDISPPLFLAEITAVTV